MGHLWDPTFTAALGAPRRAMPQLQYKTMVAAMHHLAKEKGWALDKVYVWADYSSMCHREPLSPRPLLAI